MLLLIVTVIILVENTTHFHHSCPQISNKFSILVKINKVKYGDTRQWKQIHVVKYTSSMQSLNAWYLKYSILPNTASHIDIPMLFVIQYFVHLEFKVFFIVAFFL